MTCLSLFPSKVLVRIIFLSPHIQF
uniref:Uncharacterized protein n=1 Tax=Arundo donax TaxID=35708 RepID=A0A0A8YEI1_ARUDO